MTNAPHQRLISMMNRRCGQLCPSSRIFGITQDEDVTFALELRHQAMRLLSRIITCVSSLAGIVDYFEGGYCSENGLPVKCRAAGPSPALYWKPDI
jgi:hypothetical protein